MIQPDPRPAGTGLTERLDPALPATDPPSVPGQLDAHYAVRRPEEVTAFLHAHPHLVPLLIEATAVVPRYFEPGAPLVLEVVTDPDDVDPRPELFALIDTWLDPKDAAAQLERLDEDWRLDHSPSGPGVLVLDIEFV